jgi:membrane-associated phospholipid phosphatase
LAFVACGAGIPQAHAEDRFAKFVSGPGTVLFVGAGIGLPLLRDGEGGGAHAVRAFNATATGVLLAEGLKRATRVPRPDTGTRDSFPSGHATAAFAVATIQAANRPREAPLWYLGAAAIAQSRVSLNRHRVSDVLAGAALGYLTARAELSTRRGLLINPPSDGQGFGLRFTGRF